MLEEFEKLSSELQNPNLKPGTEIHHRGAEDAKGRWGRDFDRR
jgi:hypothetical protein